MNVIGYVRVSTDEQALGPVAQRHALEAWCQSNGADLAAVHEDIGVSGAAAIDKRPGLLAALDSLEPGFVLLAAKRDRLARDVVASAMIERMAERAGARVATADGVGEGDGPEALLMRRIVDAMAEYERALIRGRTRAALAAKKARGEAVGRPGYGYAIEGGKLALLDGEAAVMARVADLRAGGLTLQAIADVLNGEGIPTKRGGRWQPQTIKNLLARAGE